MDSEIAGDLVLGHHVARHHANVEAAYT